ncbi:hypothetical protein T492DRAFT_1149002 [Pavlovales sp. CCMP2436]|nr:hypothetical protein T492DRAFT_1149002 [Pavlovales sp. CCMP2436]
MISSRFPALRVLSRGLAKKAAGKDAKGGAAKKGAAPPSAESLTVVRGINFMKSGEDPPILPDGEYPPWLWELTKPAMAYPDARKRYESGEEMDKMELKAFFTLRRKMDIKIQNLELAKQ